MASEMMLHELHPALVHAPLALLPTAATADLLATLAADRAWAKVGRRLWVAGTAAALGTGIAGLAASREVRADLPRARDMMFLHGLGNLVITTSAVGLTAWRLRNEPTAASVALGLGACCLALYTATLGGKMVYELGVGINAMPPDTATGTREFVPLLSREAPEALVRDALEGLRWVAGRARRWLAGERLAPGAEGVRPPDMPTHYAAVRPGEQAERAPGP